MWHIVEDGINCRGFLKMVEKKRSIFFFKMQQRSAQTLLFALDRRLECVSNLGVFLAVMSCDHMVLC